MIQSFRHAGLEKFFLSGSKGGIQPEHAARLEEQLSVLQVAKRPKQMDVPGWGLHPVQGKRKGQWAVWASASWRLIFQFEGEDAIQVDYEEYR